MRMLSCGFVLVAGTPMIGDEKRACQKEAHANAGRGSEPTAGATGASRARNRSGSARRSNPGANHPRAAASAAPAAAHTR